ncbi:hypothetical protein [Microbulbifer spongiae]|uniref:DUF705 domain-containing protein n=1 Tax=Microbulbifer spongiae TaxID=2944933 RepID=A0ABY9EC29_9GAMM|nr:hypothetical protein [Microbulbifer sp. MI-G]WKD50588.1 hypothetical protein M8T91_03945 [Microbulbifer sp. MI-G]
MTPTSPLTFFVDVDDTFVRSYGSKRIPIPATIEHLKKLNAQGAVLYCWSSGGAEYARNSAAEFDIENIFSGFLPKPQVIIDDLHINEWRNLIQIHPNSCASKDINDYKEELKK